MTKAIKSQGTTLWVGTTASDGSGDTYVQVSRVLGLSGGFGPEAAEIDATALEDTAKEYLKGIVDYGVIEVTGRRVVTDAGQEDLEQAAAAAADAGYNFRIRRAGIGASAANVQWTFKAHVTKFKTVPGEVDGVMSFEASLRVTGAVTQGTYT